MLPQLDSSWKIIDAQVFASPQGPGVEFIFDTPDPGRMNHFALRAGGFAITAPRNLQFQGAAVSWFQIGKTAHMLITEIDGPEPLTWATATVTARFY